VDLACASQGADYPGVVSGRGRAGQHGFPEARVSLWVDGDLAFCGRVTGAARKKFGIIPTDSMQGSLPPKIVVRSGQHKMV
jgi:hypothetical protein